MPSTLHGHTVGLTRSMSLNTLTSIVSNMHFSNSTSLKFKCKIATCVAIIGDRISSCVYISLSVLCAVSHLDESINILLLLCCVSTHVGEQFQCVCIYNEMYASICMYVCVSVSLIQLLVQVMCLVCNNIIIALYYVMSGYPI